MSFRTDEEPALEDYWAAMRRAAATVKTPKVDLVRLDEVVGDYEISQAVMDKIRDADFVIADYTLSPHNVYFEAGFARGCAKPVISVARKGTSLQFDVRNWRTVFYRNATQLEAMLGPELNAMFSAASPASPTAPAEG